MANEFIARKGLIALEDSQITGSLNISSTLKIPGFNNVSASLAAAVAGGDNLGNHTALEDLKMGGFAITNVGNVDGVDVSALNTSVSTNTTNITTLTAATSSYLTSVSDGTLSGSAQIATEISGAFTAASSSFSTRVTANDAKVSYTDAAVTSIINAAGILSSSAQIASDISGSITGRNVLLGNITASGTISASSMIATSFTGTLLGSALTAATAATTDAVNFTNASNDVEYGLLFRQGNGTSAQTVFADSQAATPAWNPLKNILTVGGPLVATIITASGNISASGDIIAPNLIADSASFSTRVTANDAKVSYTDAAVTSVINAANILSSSAQIAPDISGSFTAASASFSTKVTANDAKLTANTSNVRTAGALMDDELSEIATVKALTAAGISGSFTAASASFSTRVTANDAKISYTDAAVTSVINAANIISSSAQLDFVDTTGTPAVRQLAIFNDADTIKGESTLNFSNEAGLVINNASVGSNPDGIKVHGNIFGSGSHIRLRNAEGGGGSGFYLSSSGDLAGGSFKILTGDIGGVGNSTLLTVDDANEQITTSKTLGVTGNITVTGTVDGRDVAADGTKLDGITTAGISGSFTATSASFSTRVTANDAKLTANTSNVQSAGALMDSELAEIATVKALTKAGISGSFTAASASLAANIATNTGNIGTTTNTLTVDNATLQLNTGTTFNGSAARTISIKDGGVDSDALAADIEVTTLTATKIITTQFTSSFITSSTIVTEGSNTFGDTSADTHTFNGKIIAVNDISASGDIIAHSASFTGPVKISLATEGTALEITEEDEDQKGRLLFEYDDGNPTLTIASRASTAKLHIRQDSGTNGLYFDEDGQIYVNNSTQDGVKIDGTSFSSIGTNANALDLGKKNRPWKDLYLTGDGANIFFQDNSTSPELTLNYPANSNRLILSASDGHPSASFEVMGDISASGDLSALDLNLFGGGLSIKNKGAQSYARFYCESNNAHYTEIKAQEHANFSGNVTLLLPAYDFDFASPDFGSADLAANNLSGTNTGDQDLSGLALKTAVSGAFTADSASFSTRVTANDAKLTANASNVQSAGALMDSELTDLAGVKGVTISTLQVKPSEGAFVNGDKTKLDGIEASADVTDTSNVTSAGALMDSELAEIATVKALTKAGISGSFTADSASFSTRVTANDAKLTANTSNVTAAGALMDSELAELTTVRALTKAGITGSFTAASASFSTRLTTNDAKLTANTSNVTAAGALMDSELSNLAAVKAINQGLTTTSDVTFNDVDVDGTLSIPGINDVSASLAAAIVGGDNLGNHTATQELDLDDNNIKDALHITASGNISSSGKVTSNTLDVDGFISLGGVNSIVNNSGTITFGNNSNVTQIRSSGNISIPGIITANITASGNISASGFISASAFVGDGSGLTGLSSAAITTYNNSGDNRILTSVNSTTVNSEANLTFDGSGLSVTGHITASGNISASNTTHTKFLRIPQTAGNSTEGAIYFGDSVSDNNGYIYDDANNLQIGYNDSDILQVNDSTPQVVITGDLKVLGGGAGTITATGKISGSSMESSGDIHLSTSNTQITQKLSGGATRDLIGFDGNDNAVIGNPTANKIKLEGNVTASNDISASGTITMLTASIGGGTFTSASLAGAIASAGDITGVTAGSGLSGGGSSGAVTVNVDYGSGTIITDAGAFNTGGTSVTSDLLLVHHNDDGEAQKVGITAFMDEYKIVNRTGTPVDNDYAKFTDANTIEGRSFSEVKTDLSLGNVTNESKATMFTSPTFTGNVTMGTASIEHRLFDTGSTHLDANSAIGDIVKFGGGDGDTVAGGIYFLKHDGTWALAQANAASTATASLAVAVGTNPSVDGMCLRGFVNPFSDPGAGIGSPVYLADTHQGRFLATAPDSNNDVVRILGHQYGTDLIYFNPSNDFIVITA